MTALTFIFAIIFGYLIGSIPFGLVLTKRAGLGDIRKIGSGNIGATNVLRTGNKALALATLFLDSGKGAIAVMITYFIADYNAAMLAGFFALVGHCYPLWLEFKGGKGVATALGVLIALAPILGSVTCVIWVMTALFSRISSLSALVAIGLTPVISYSFYGESSLSGLCAFIAAIIYLKHRENIKRIFEGNEPKIGQDKKPGKK